MDISVQLIPQIVAWVSTIGVAVFALSGAIYAAEREMDILGFILIGTVTGVGGGTFRDLLLGVPVFWVEQPYYVYLCAAASVLAYFIGGMIRLRRRWMLWLDAAGLAAFAVMGTQVSLLYGAPTVIAVVTGVMSATFGGIMRDVLCAETLTLTQPEMYVTCAVFGSVLYILLTAIGLNPSIAVGIAFVGSFALRMAAIIYGLTLPKYSTKQ